MSEELRNYLSLVLQVANAVLTGAVWLYARYGNRNKEIDAKFDALRNEFDRRLDDQNKEMTGISERLKFAPTHADLGEIHEKINFVQKDVARIQGTLDGMGADLRMLVKRAMEKD